MINVGINPTVNYNNDLKIEAHILDFSSDSASSFKFKESFFASKSLIIIS